MSTYVTKPYLPPLEEFIPYLEKIWESRILSNGGEFHIQLEQELCSFLKVNHVSLVGNGTLALMVAFKALGLEGCEVITTPYSFVATSSSLLWSGNTPVYVDIDPNSPNIDPRKIENAVTEKTKAILAVHSYGHPCEVQEIENVANKYGLKVIYDAAHAFGVETSRGSILNWGDVSALSFHATKVFNTFEGGAIICNSQELKTKIDRLKNFGFAGEISVNEVGINAKMTEFNAALGLLQLKYYKQSIEMRARVHNLYVRKLTDCRGISCLENNAATTKNYAYFPVLINEDFGMSRDDLYTILKKEGIYTRRYFYPLISDFSIYHDLPSSRSTILSNARKLANKVLCLPIFPDMQLEVVEKICDIIKSAHSRNLHGDGRLFS